MYISLKDITAVVGLESELLPKGFTVLSGMEKVAQLGCETEDELTEWMTLINGACVCFCDSLGVLSYSVRVKTFSDALERYTGGIAKREEIEEEWQYRKSGALVLQSADPKHVNGKISYHWDGMTLCPSDKTNAGYGKGMFDGLVLSWYAPRGLPIGFDKKKKKVPGSAGKKRQSTANLKSRSSTVTSASSLTPPSPGSGNTQSSSPTSSPSPIASSSGSIPTLSSSGASDELFDDEPCIKYLWVPNERAYYVVEGRSTVISDDLRNWKWSRHFLTKISGIGHWISEGSIPEHVLMLLQMMRYQRMGFPSANPEQPEVAAATPKVTRKKKKRSDSVSVLPTQPDATSPVSEEK